MRMARRRYHFRGVSVAGRAQLLDILQDSPDSAGMALMGRAHTGRARLKRPRSGYPRASALLHAVPDGRRKRCGRPYRLKAGAEVRAEKCQ